MATISRISSADAGLLAGVRALFDLELGKGLYPARYLAEAAADPDSLLLGIVEAGEVAAAAVARLLAPADLGYYRDFGPVLELLSTHRRLGSLEAMAVAPAHRRRGLGLSLVRARLRWFAERGCTAALAVSWISNRPGASAPLFRRAGMSEGPTVPDFYFEDSLLGGWACPVDGKPCRCAATLFWCELAGTG